MKNEALQGIFAYMLSRPPSRSGLRLRSEPELARLFNMNRQAVRRSLDGLVVEGYLTRKHGSGTYVRKVFNAQEAPSEAAVRLLCKVVPEQIFIEDPPNSLHCPDHGKHRLKIGLPGDSALLTWANQAFFSGARSRLEALGHKAVAYSNLCYDTSAHLDTEGLARELRKCVCDGYIVECQWAERFQAAVKLVAADAPLPPVTYFWPGSIAVTHEPLIQLDTDEAVERAVRIMAANGRGRIALLTTDAPSHPASSEQERYQREMERAGLAYRCCLTIEEGFLGADLKRRLTELWERGGPDALYVSDDHFLPTLHDWMVERQLIPGRELAVICLWNRGGALPGGVDWSRMEFDPRQAGGLAVDTIVKGIDRVGEGCGSWSLQAAWIPGSTHGERVG